MNGESQERFSIMQKDTTRVYEFIRVFEGLYGRKPSPRDAEGHFRIRVAQEMEMSVGGARYYLRLAVRELEQENSRRGGRCTEP
jgi:hypothetical protein